MLAMEFVLQLDELIFAALAPVSVQSTLSRVQPLRVPRLAHYKGLDLWAVYSLVAVLVPVCLFTVMMILPQQALLQAGKDALCGGNLDFVATVNGAGFAGWSEIQDSSALHGRNLAEMKTDDQKRWDSEWPEERLGYVPQALRALIGPITGRVNNCHHGHGVCFQGMKVLDTVDHRHLSTADFNRTIDFNGIIDDCCLAWQTHLPRVADGAFTVEAFSAETAAQAGRIFNSRCEDGLNPPAIRSDPSSYVDDNGSRQTPPTSPARFYPYPYPYPHPHP